MSCEIELDVAGICVALRVADARLEGALKSRYGVFLDSGREPRARILVEVQEGAKFEPKPPATMDPAVFPVSVSFSQRQLDFESSFEAGTIDLDSGEGRLVMAPGPEGDIENFLRALYAWLCLENHSLLLHAASVVREGKAYVFFGNSGSGKTTIANLSAEHTVLGDDLAVVSVAEGACWVHGVPFRGASFEWPSVKTRVSLGGIFRLRKDVAHRAFGLEKSHAVAELMACLPFVSGYPPNCERAMAICEELVARVPVKALHFRRDHDFWRAVLSG